jgi:hypothetical protein
MRLREFSDDNMDSGLVTVLSFLANRAEDSDAPAKMSTQSVINMVSNSGSYFDYEALAHAYESDPTVKNLIKEFDKDTITLRLPGDEEPTSSDELDNDEDDFDSVDSEEGEEKHPADQSFDDIGGEEENGFEEEPKDTVGDMAKRALHRGR